MRRIWSTIRFTHGWKPPIIGSKSRCCLGQLFSPLALRQWRLWGGAIPDAVQFGSSLVVWGAAVRTVLVWHITWSVNSVTHLWGYRNYETPDNSRNNILIGLLAGGEGWHNNHHAAPTSARHGHHWWEFDLAWLTIRVFMLLGLATKVSLPSPNLAATFKSRAKSAPTQS